MPRYLLVVSEGQTRYYVISHTVPSLASKIKNNEPRYMIESYETWALPYDFSERKGHQSNLSMQVVVLIRPCVEFASIVFFSILRCTEYSSGINQVLKFSHRDSDPFRSCISQNIYWKFFS